MFQHDGNFLTALFVAEIESSDGAKTHRGNVRVRAETLFVVVMPSHSLIAISVEIEKRWQGLADMAAKAFRETGHQLEPVELVQGLLNALENPKCRKRWAKGNSALLGQ